ncbi:ribosomal RNA small subunit methyltransferase A [Candidatus Bathyarchaeota archaeon]|nr:MAG: ribosomal RNA small subunit methyltransferase A [Candidatus Bathyarchaeota archaeon]
MELLKTVRRLLREYEVKPRKKLGQSFLVDKSLMERMVEYANLKKDDVVVEVGAGFGFLTEILAEKAGRVFAVEVDPKLVKILERRLKRFNNVKIIQADFLKLNLKNFDKVVSSPPYSIISKIIFKLLNTPFKVAVLLLQKEFALRLSAKPGEKNYGRLTVMGYVKSEVEILEEVPSKAFYPEPEVSSMVVRIKPRREPPFKIEDWKIFEQTVRFLFTQKNRKLKNALQTLSKQEEFKCLRESFKDFPYLEKRVFMLKPEEFCEILNLIYLKSKTY